MATENKTSATNEYSVATLIDIARIPKDRIPALMAELPRLVETIRPIAEFVDLHDPDQMRLIARSMIWVDDGITDGSKDETKIEIQLVPPTQ